MMLLAIDVGNTNTVIGLFRNSELLVHWRISTDPYKTADEFWIFLFNLLNLQKYGVNSIEQMVISSVVPPVVMALDEMAKEYLEISPLVVGPGIKTGINIKLDNPRELGADRLVNAVAAHEIIGGPVIIVDFGTATTFCAVTEDGEYLGGAIAPGIETSIEALFKRAAKLPRVEIDLPSSVIGRSTEEAMQSGIIYGFASQIDGVVSRIKKELSPSSQTIATGGLAEMICRHTATIDHVDQLLTLKGLYYIATMNS